MNLNKYHDKIVVLMKQFVNMIISIFLATNMN